MIKFSLDLGKGKTANFSSGDDIPDLKESLDLTLSALHAYGFSYIENLIAIVGPNTNTSATGERYAVRQIYSGSQHPETKVVIELDALTRIKQDLDFYKQEAEGYKNIRNKLAEEINGLLVELGRSPKYEMV